MAFGLFVLKFTSNCMVIYLLKVLPLNAQCLLKLMGINERYTMAHTHTHPVLSMIHHHQALAIAYLNSLSSTH